MATTAGGESASQAGQPGNEPHVNDTSSTGMGGGIAQTLRDSTYKRIDEQKTRASDTLGSLAGAVRGMSQPLRDGGQQGVADYVNQAADGIERWAADLRHRDLEDTLRAVQTFARRQPVLFLGVAFTAGVLAVRFLKSSGNGGNGKHLDRGDWQGTPPAQLSAAGGDYGDIYAGSLGDDSMGSDLSSTGDVASPTGKRSSGKRNRSSGAGRSAASSSAITPPGSYETSDPGGVQYGTTGGAGTGTSTTGRNTGEVS